jgi:hypothetical protein
MDFADIKDSIGDRMANFNEQLNDFFGFLGKKLGNFSRLALGEQIAYSCIGVGGVLILVAIILFLLL